jgi:tetratricopeptide (TPR) repeat protein
MSLLALPLFALLASGAVQAPAAAPGPAPATTDVLAEARELVNQGKPQEALARLQPLDAANPRVALLLGVARYHSGDPAAAVAALTPIVDRLPAGSPEAVEATQVLGLCLYLAGRIEQSVPYLERTRAALPDNPDLAYVLGMAFIKTGQAAKARDVWSSAFGVKPGSAASHLVTAQMMVRAELDEAAEAELKQALAKEPTLPHAHFLLGQSALFRGRLDESVDLFRRELELNPGNAQALYRLGDAYSRQGKWDEAMAALQRSIWINPFFSGPYILLGKGHGQKGNVTAAEAMWRRAIEYDPRNKAAHYLLAQLLQKTGRTEEARREFETAEALIGAADR